MKKIIIAGFAVLLSQTTDLPAQTIPASSSPQTRFVQNFGQIVDFDQQPRNEFLYYVKTDKLDIYFRDKGITYIFKKGDDLPKISSLRAEEQDKVVKEYMNKQTQFCRMDVDFVNAGSNMSIAGKGVSEYYQNFYFAHCPQGIMNVKSFEKIKYKNVYEGIDLEFYFLYGKFKYDVIVNPGGNINNIRLKFKSSDKIELTNNEVVIESPVGQIIESLPESYIVNENGGKSDAIVKYELSGNEVQFKSDYDQDKLLVIDPQISWTTYYDDCFWNGLGSSIDAKGNQVLITSYGFSNNFPVLDPGGSAYFQNLTAGSGDYRILKFDSNGVRIWATYYGGTGYDNISHVKIDYAGNVIVAGHTESSNIPTQNAGGYYDASYDAGTFGGGTFIVKFNSSGVRQWATHYDYVSYPFVEVDLNNNVYVVGRSEYNDPPVLSLVGAYNQALVSHDAGGTNHSSDIFIVKFNSATTRIWATNLGSTTDEIPQDLKCGSDNFLNILGISDCYSGTGLVTQNPMGGAYYDNTTGPSGTNRDDALIYRFNTAGAMFWGTAFGGTANDNVQQGRITTDNANNIYIYAETSNATLPFTDPGSGAYYDNTFQSGGSGFNPFIARFTSLGVLDWCTFFGSYGLGFGMNFSNYLGINTSNNLIVVTTDGGGIGGTFPVVPRMGDYNATLNVYMGVYIAEFNSNLNIAWSTYYAGSPTDRNTLGDAVLTSSSCGYQLYMTTRWEKYDALAIDPPWVKPIPASYQNTVFFPTGNESGLITRFSNLPSVAPTGITASSNPICAGDPTTLTVNGGSLGTGAVWTWYSGSCGGTPEGTGTSIVVSPAVTTTYYVAAVGGCNTTTCASITITVNTISTAPTSITASVNPVCVGSSTTLTVNGGSLGTGASWLWYSGTCGGTPEGTGTSITVSPGGTTTYYVLAQGTCNTTTCASITINISTNSTAPTSINATVNPICPGDATTLSVNGGSLGTGASWQWYSGTCGGTPEGSGSSISVSPGITTTYYVLAQGICDTTTCVSLVVNVNIVNAEAGNNQTICLGDNATLTATGGGTYLWSELAQTTPSISVSPTTTTTYSVTVYNGGCSASDQVTVNVTTSADATISTAGPFCLTDSAVNLIAVDPGGTWAGTGITNASVGTFDPSVAGVGSFQIIYSIPGSCGDADTVLISVTDILNATIVPVGPYCLNNIPVNLTAATAGGVWTGGGITNASSGLFNPAVAGVGLHIIIYTISGNCGNVDTISITVYDIPEGTATATGETCTGANDGTGSVSVSGGLAPYTYNWSNTETTQTVNNLPPDIYTVTITDAHSCSIIDTAEVIASSIPCDTYTPHVYVPNIFSPNNDGQNDVLYVYGKGIKTLLLVIYDRWGEKVFETTDVNTGWDGRYKGKDMDAAVFVYYLKATLDNDEKVDIKGNITLVR